MKPVCVPCQRFFRMVKSGFYFIEGMPTDNDARPGTADANKWGPYKIWVGDRWECEGCHAAILSGFGSQPLGEHYQPEFKRLVEETNAAQLQVNDC